jgi:hypothetical protein
MSQRTLSILWKLTGLVAFVLLLTTVGLAMKAGASDDIALTGYVAGSGSSVYLRAQPSVESRIITILERDTAVSITNTRSRDNQTWYYVKVETEAGWIPAENISLDPP